MHTAPVIIMTILLSIYGYTSSRMALGCNYWEDNLFNLHANCSRRKLKLVPVVSLSITYLDLSSNLIEVIENKTFTNLSILQDLDLSFNQLKRLNQESFLGLKNLKRLNLGFNLLIYTSLHFCKSIFQPLKSLTYLDIGWQDISIPRIYDHFWFSKYVISDLSTLQSLVIDFRCTKTDCVFREEFILLTNLTNVKLTDCYMEANLRAFSNVPNVEDIDINSCGFSSYAQGTLHVRKLNYLNLENIIDLDIQRSILEDLNKTPIQTLVLSCFSYCDLFLSELFNIVNETFLQNVYLNHNTLIFVNNRNALPSTLKNLDLSSNTLFEVCLNMPKLKVLNLERNDLGEFLRSHTYYLNNPITYPTNLVEINLSFNKLYQLNDSIFKGHRSLSSLNLSNNFFADINFDIFHLKYLKVIDLSNNRIQKFSKESMDQLDVVFDLTCIRINLAGNSLQCSCDAIEFIEWILDKNEYFIEKSKTKCRFVNETEIFLTDFKQTMMELKKTCSSRLVLISSLAVAITSLMIIMSIGIVYRYRWRLRYMYYMTKNKYIRDHLTRNDDRNYSYEAFISYSDDEQDFIMNECIPILEDRYNVKLCIHKRDFLPGREILHNITNSIHESRNVICILTKSFLESYYCMFEFNMARMESIYARNGKNMLFLVFYEQLRPKDLPLVMLELVEKDSYIEYPNDEQGNIVFWEKLKEAMT